MGFAAWRHRPSLAARVMPDSPRRTVIASTRATNPSWITPIECVPHLLSLADERVPEEKVRLILVVRAAAELDVVRRGCASRRVRRDVMELEERGLAAPACPSNKRAAALIAQPHCTPDGRRYMTSRCRTLARARPR